MPCYNQSNTIGSVFYVDFSLQLQRDCFSIVRIGWMIVPKPSFHRQLVNGTTVSILIAFNVYQCIPT
jgi:hypothetical protein